MEAIGLLAGGVAHDFNNILSVILGYSSLLKMDGGLDNDQLQRIEAIVDSADKAAQLTYGLLAFSRKQPLFMKNEDLNNIIRHVHKFVSRIIGEDIIFRTDTYGTELPVHADRGQIEQVLINLATNARDAMSKGGIFSIKSELAILDKSFMDFHKCDVPPGKYAMLTVSDTGSGISKEHLDHIFEPFFTTKEVGKGTGLGMAIIYGVIKQHNGFINVYSELGGHGTTFSIYLPLQEANSHCILDQVEAAPIKGGSETILVSEDDLSVRELVSKVLTKHGYETILAVDGEDAIEKFKVNQERISLVLMDLIMPKKNGKDAYEEIQRIMPSVKVLFSIGYTADFIEHRGGFETGGELMMKPLQPVELLRKVREILDK
jgi:polar amino acid transport system substrate-binding protein